MLTLEEGREVVKLARRTIETYLKEGRKPEPPEEVSGEMGEDRGVFVTLNKDGRLRGCIGRPLPTQKLIDGVMDSAISAATQDPRFPEVQPEELENITIEVSVLTLPEKIEVEDAKKCPEEVKIGRDGLIVKCRGREGLLLPQVPLDQNWDPEEFLSQTCIKAGLTPDSWLRDDVEIEKFSAQVFEEEEPRGKVGEERLTSG